MLKELGNDLVTSPVCFKFISQMYRRNIRLEGAVCKMENAPASMDRRVEAVLALVRRLFILICYIHKNSVLISLVTADLIRRWILITNVKVDKRFRRTKIGIKAEHPDNCRRRIGGNRLAPDSTLPVDPLTIQGRAPNWGIDVMPGFQTPQNIANAWIGNLLFRHNGVQLQASPAVA